LSVFSLYEEEAMSIHIHCFHTSKFFLQTFLIHSHFQVCFFYEEAIIYSYPMLSDFSVFFLLFLRKINHQSSPICSNFWVFFFYEEAMFMLKVFSSFRSSSVWKPKVVFFKKLVCPQIVPKVAPKTLLDPSKKQFHFLHFKQLRMNHFFYHFPWRKLFGWASPRCPIIGGNCSKLKELHVRSSAICSEERFPLHSS
jgi:hypothetical protein